MCQAAGLVNVAMEKVTSGAEALMTKVQTLPSVQEWKAVCRAYKTPKYIAQTPVIQWTEEDLEIMEEWLPAVGVHVDDIKKYYDSIQRHGDSDTEEECGSPAHQVEEEKIFFEAPLLENMNEVATPHAPTAPVAPMAPRRTAALVPMVVPFIMEQSAPSSARTSLLERFEQCVGEKRKREPQRTRSGRPSKMPARYNDFVLRHDLCDKDDQ